MGTAPVIFTPKFYRSIAYIGEYVSPITMFFRPDRTAFHAGTHTETEAYHRAREPTALAELLRVAIYFNSGAFDFDITNPPRLDRTTFSCRVHAER